MLTWQTASWDPRWRWKYGGGGTRWKVPLCHLRPSLLSSCLKTPRSSLCVLNIEHPASVMHTHSLRDTCIRVWTQTHHTTPMLPQWNPNKGNDSLSSLKKKDSTGKKSHWIPTRLTAVQLITKTRQESLRRSCCLNRIDYKSSKVYSLNIYVLYRNPKELCQHNVMKFSQFCGTQLTSPVI